MFNGETFVRSNNDVVAFVVDGVSMPRVARRETKTRARAWAIMTLGLELQRLLKEILAKNSRDAIRA